MTDAFVNARPVWSESDLCSLNVSLFFVVPLSGRESEIRITASSFYRVFHAGKFIAYGPSRDAHGYFRIDRIPLQGQGPLIIEVAGYHCNSFYALNQTPFCLFETFDADGHSIEGSSKETKGYRNETRLQKVTRFSYQRAFSESYEFDPRYPLFLKTGDCPYQKVGLCELPLPNLDRRIVHDLCFPRTTFRKIEEGVASLDASLPIYQDRYQTTEYLKIFPKDEWEIDANAVASQLSYRLAKVGDALRPGTFFTYALPSSLTGFFELVLDVQEDALLYLLFDEVNVPSPTQPGMVGISFYRNTTHNCITYSLKKGHYRLLSFEPYTAHFARLVCLGGAIKVSSFRLVRYENPDAYRIHYSFENKKIERVFASAVSTFAQNAVDLLTDCPSRERAGWLCDSFFSGQVEPLLTGFNLEEEAFLDAYAKCKKDDLPEGMIPMCYPADFPSKEYIPNWSLWYILELERFKKRNGDVPLIAASRKNIEGILSYFKKLENDDGMLENLQGWVFVEWSKANDPEFIAGVNAPSNMLYAAALIAASSLLGDPSLKAKGEALKAAIKKMFFRGDFFVDNAIRDEAGPPPLPENMSETCQYYALYFGVASLEDDPAFAKRMMESFGEYRDDKAVYPMVYKSNLLMGIMMRLEWLNRLGKHKEVFAETIDYFDKMATLTGTLWEHDDVNASLNHCFASYVVHFLLEANFGLLYIDEANKEIHLKGSSLCETGTVSLPLRSGGRLFLQGKEGKRIVRKPKDYSLALE